MNKSSTFVTWEFQNTINTSSIYPSTAATNEHIITGQKFASPATRIAGFYAEIKLAKAFLEICRNNGIQAPDFKSNANQRDAEANFEYRQVKHDSDPEYIRQVGVVGERVRYITNAAAHLLFSKLENEIRAAAANGTFEIKDTAVGTEKTFQDLVIQIGNVKHRIEVKWQASDVKSNNSLLRIFSETSDKTLFGENTFEQYLANNGVLEHTIAETVWKQKVISALGGFLDEYIGNNPTEQFKYLLYKGHIPEGNSDIKEDKIFVNGNATDSQTILNIFSGGDLMGYLAGQPQNNLVQNIQKSNYSSAVQYILNGTGPLGVFGMEDYGAVYKGYTGRNTRKNIDAAKKEGKRAKVKGQKNFNFAFYVYNKSLQNVLKRIKKF